MTHMQDCQHSGRLQSAQHMNTLVGPARVFFTVLAEHLSARRCAFSLEPLYAPCGVFNKHVRITLHVI